MPVPTRGTTDPNASADINLLQSQITTNASNIATNTADIATNTSAIASITDNTISITKTGNYTILDSDTFRVIYVNGNYTIDLPTLADNQDKEFLIMNIGSTTVTVDGEGAETIDGLATIELPKAYDYIKIKAQSSEWKIIDEKISCQLRLYTYAGFGSTDTCILRFTTTVDNYGNMFSENHSTGYNSNTEGLEITIDKPGKYSFDFSIRNNTNQDVGLSINSAQLTTRVRNINQSDKLSVQLIAGAASVDMGAVSWSGYLAVNDVIRAHSDNAGGTPTEAVFTATYLGS